VPGLAPFAENRLTIEALDLPLSLEPARLTLYYAPPYRGGGTVEFSGTTRQGFYGRLFWLKDGERAPAELAGLALEVGGQTVESVVGMDGEFYLEDLPPGRYAGRLYLEDRQENFELIVPRSSESLVNLGDIDSR
jgi:outer membrane usher protein